MPHVKAAFPTDGISKCIRLRNLELSLLKTSSRMMATAGTTCGSIIQALRHLGKAHVNDTTVKQLDSRLSPADHKRLSAAAAFAPAWIGDIRRRLASKT